MAASIKKCPKCHHLRHPEEIAAPECCPACGLYFEKWANRHTPASSSTTSRKSVLQNVTGESGWRVALRNRLTNIAGQGDPVQFYFRASVLALLTIWGIHMARLDFRHGEMGASFMHNILLPIHEAGHVLFMPFGEFMVFFGGSFFQLLLPLIVAATVLWQNRDPFGAALGIWWCGVSLMDLAPYIYDAKMPQLTMLGGHTGSDGPHDWIYLLGVFGKIHQSQLYGAIVHKLGVIIMLAAVVAAATVLWRMWIKRHDRVLDAPFA